MMRKIAIGLAAAVIATGGLTLSASAYRGGAAGPVHAATAHADLPHAAFRIAAGMARAGPRSYGMYRQDRYRGHHFDHWRHHWRPGYSNYSYSGGGSCWRNIWTGNGWTRQWVCGYGRPYGYGGGYYRHGYGPRYGHWGGGRRPVYGRR
jgi:hypothetical protein